MIVLAMFSPALLANNTPNTTAATPNQQLETIVVTASADASAQGLLADYAGGDVATGGRVGIFGNQKTIDTPFHSTSYTNQYIQDHQAKSVGDVLLADPSVRTARGFGNFQESYFIRGFNLSSDDTAYNGLYSILPRQYIASELFERVEVLKGASTAINGATPGNGGIGGAINLLPKRAGNEPLNRINVNSNLHNINVATDIARRFGADQQFGVRVNAAYRGENTPVDGEKSELALAAIGLDYRQDRLRLSGDMGLSDNRLTATRPSVTVTSAAAIPQAPSAKENFAQPWTYSNEKDIFGSYRAEFDFNDALTAYGAYGFRLGEEENTLANFSLTNATTGAGTIYRFDNAREDTVQTAEIGLRANFNTGSIQHNAVIAGSWFDQKVENAYLMDFFNSSANNLYNYQTIARPSFASNAFAGNADRTTGILSPKLNRRTRLESVVIGDNITALNDALTVSLAGRYQKIINDNYAYNTGVHSRTYDDAKITPTVGVNYKFTPNLAMYANYAEALVQGGTAPSTAQNVGEILKPFVSKQKEAGIKFDNEQFGVGATYFHTSQQRGITGTDNIYRADGENVHQGVELYSYGQITDNFKVLGGVTWLDAQQKQTQNGILDGKKVIGVPEVQANVEATYQLPQDIALNARVIYTGKVYANSANTLTVPAWTRVDLGASYKTKFGQVPTKLQLRVDNVANKNYWASSGGDGNNGYLTLGQPRTVTLGAQFDF